MADAVVASMLPDNMESAGLADDFDGTVEKIRLVPWDYNGKLDHHILAAAVTIKPDEDSGFDTFVQYYSAGDLRHWVPSVDGKTPVDLDGENIADMEGLYALKVGSQNTLQKNSNWAAFLRALIDAGFPPGDFKASVDFAEGVYGHFNRVEQEKRPGLQQNKDRAAMLLVVTEIHKKASKAAATKAAAPKAAAKAAPASGGDLEERVTNFVLEQLAAADGTSMAKAKLPPLVAGAFDGADKAPAIKLVASIDFLSASDMWNYDGDTGTLSLG